MPEVKIWEAVALSLNIEPTKTKTDRNAWMGADHPFIEGEEFDDRLQILRANRTRKNFPTPCALNLSRWHLHVVRVDEFATWAQSIEWEMPPELAALCANATPSTANVAPSIAELITSKARRNTLDPLIEKAIEQADSVESADVWLKLKELAIRGESPFTGEAAEKSLSYTNDDNEVTQITKGALAKRLKARIKAASSG